MKPIKFFNENWGVHYYSFVGWKWEDFVKYCSKKLGLIVTGSPGLGYAAFSSEIGGVMWVRNKNDHSTIAHEALHLTNFTLDHAGVVPSFTDDESQAYLMGYIVKNAFGKK